MNDLISIQVQVRTKAKGSAWFQVVQVDRAAWAEMNEEERRKLAMTFAMKMISVSYAEVTA